MKEFVLHSKFQPTGDQPQAIEKLTEGIRDGLRTQVLLGVTGSGKTFTMANVIKNCGRPALVIAHNKTLAAQLAAELKEFFPDNAVVYFVSYYDYYQPEAYIPSTDTYIEKDSAINDEIDRLRHSATAALSERRDVIIVASVSCIYSLGDPIDYRSMVISLRPGMQMERDELCQKLVTLQYERNDVNFVRNKFRVHGDTVDIYLAYMSELAIRVEFFGDEIDRITEFNPLTGSKQNVVKHVAIFPASHYIVSAEKKAAALEKQFPLLENIRVERDYPGTVVVRVTEAQPAWAMQTSSGWLTLSGGLKILEKDSAQPAGLPTLYGGEPVSAEPGEQLTFAAEPKADSTPDSTPDSAADSSASGTVEEEADQRLESLNTLLAALDAAGMSADVTRIEFADVDEMAFLYQDRISVWLGTLNELEYKLKLAKHVLLNEDGKGCAATDTGKLDFTHISMSSTRKFTFAQGEPELPSGYIVPEPVEETPAEEGVTGETAEGTATDGTAPAEGEAAADAAAETPTDTAAAPAGPEAGPTAQPTPAEGTTPAAGDANQPQTTQ